MIDNEYDRVPGSREAKDVLRSDPIFRVVGRRLANPWILGMVLYIVVIMMIALGPSTESRFIYTDF